MKNIVIFLQLTMLTFCLFLLLGAANATYAKIKNRPADADAATAPVSGRFFAELLGFEIPHFKSSLGHNYFSAGNVTKLLFRFVTGVDVTDPKTFVAREVPGMGSRGMLVYDDGGFAGEHPVPVAQESNTTDEQEPTVADEIEGGNEKVEDSVVEDVAGDNPVPDLIRAGKPAVFIYHSHNRESWLPELKHKNVKKMNDAFDDKVNVTLLGNRLAKSLESHGIGAVHSDKDYPTEVKNFDYNFSYKYSLMSVKEAFAVNPTIQYFIDIHRDGVERSVTTATIAGESYAKVTFIVGRKNPNWEKNEALVKKVHERLEKTHPGISRGIDVKSKNHAEYNQSFSPNSILVEIGGAENTLEESKRTIDALAEALADVYWEADGEKT